MSNRPKWETITREERFFTCMLFHELRRDPKPLLDLINGKLNEKMNGNVSDVGYEVCFFRDAAFHKLIPRYKHKEKVTFDLVLWLQDDSMIILEAKAHQNFDAQQIQQLKDSQNEIKECRRCPRVALVGLISGQYHPDEETREAFDAIITWDEVAGIYGAGKEVFRRATEIYRSQNSPRS